MEENPDARAILDHAQGTKALGFALEIIKTCDFRFLNTICDLGGGSGVFLREILASYPHLKGIVADLPGAIAGARQIVAEANLQDRFDAVPCDFFKAAPPPCDAFFLVNVLHDWDDDRCVIILGNLTEAMTSDSRLFIVEYLLESRPGFSVAKLLDIEVLVMGGGRERTIEEYKALLSSAGISLMKTISTDHGPAVLECIKE